VMAGFTNRVTPNSITLGTPLPPVRLVYFRSVYVGMAPYIHGNRYTVYVMVVVYRFDELGIFVASGGFCG